MSGMRAGYMKEIHRITHYLLCSFATLLMAFFLLAGLFSGCKENKQKIEITQIVREWQNKEVVFPANMIFTKYGKDTMEYEIPPSLHKILMYVDSIGCTSCKLQLHKWKEFIREVDSLTYGTVPVIFVFNPKDLREISYLLYSKRKGLRISQTEIES